MPELLAWIASVDWWQLTKDAVIPVAAILIPTVIAVRLARNEREAAERSNYIDRRRQAAEGVILALAQMISMDPTAEAVGPLFRDLRGRIAVYRAALSAEDVLSGDWLALRHAQGTRLWNTVQDEMSGESNYRALSVDERLTILQPGQTWAHATMEMLSGWLSGHVSDSDLQTDGGQIYGALHPTNP